MTSTDKCDWLDTSTSGYGCKLRNVLLPVAEVTAKCSDADLAVMCVSAYSSLTRGQEAIEIESTDAFPWVLDSARNFQALKEYDNAIMVLVKGIEFSITISLVQKGYELFGVAREIYEEGMQEKDPSLNNPILKKSLEKAGNDLIEAMKTVAEGSVESDFQAELKASILGGISLRKTEKDEKRDIVVVDGRQLYKKKMEEYKEAAEKFISSGVFQNAITFACMAALAELMLGRAKEGMSYLTGIAAESGQSEKFQESVIFNWTKLIFRALVSKDATAIEKARTMFFDIPWSFKDDREFGRRIMDSVHRSITEGS